MTRERQAPLFHREIFCIDACALINITRYQGYPREVLPKIWKKLEEMAKNGELISHIEVYREIKDKNDQIDRWCKKNKNIFKDIDECQQEKIEMVKTRYNPDCWRRETNRERPWGDPWVIALSICEDAIIVTEENNNENHLPYVANYFNRKCLNLIDFFKIIGIQY